MMRIPSDITGWLECECVINFEQSYPNEWYVTEVVLYLGNEQVIIGYDDLSRDQQDQVNLQMISFLEHEADRREEELNSEP